VVIQRLQDKQKLAVRQKYLRAPLSRKMGSSWHSPVVPPSRPHNLLGWARSVPRAYDTIMFMKEVIVNDVMQKGYRYQLSASLGKNFHFDFKPELTPKEMLALGVFGGKYMTDCKEEFPKSWFSKAKLCSHKHDATLNFFRVNASQSLSVWRVKGWIHPEDPRGWFQWYCRYYMGRRIPGYDEIQISRWKNMRRHIAQIEKHCVRGDVRCRARQKQALLHWAYDSRRI
jgi:hypothetical protein